MSSSLDWIKNVTYEGTTCARPDKEFGTSTESTTTEDPEQETCSEWTQPSTITTTTEEVPATPHPGVLLHLYSQIKLGLVVHTTAQAGGPEALIKTLGDFIKETAKKTGVKTKQITFVSSLSPQVKVLSPFQLQVLSRSHAPLSPHCRSLSPSWPQSFSVFFYSLNSILLRLHVIRRGAAGGCVEQETDC